MSSIVHRFFVEYYDSGSWGCPDLNMMGYDDFDELSIDMNKEINKMLGKTSPSDWNKMKKITIQLSEKNAQEIADIGIQIGIIKECDREKEIIDNLKSTECLFR